MNEDLCGRQCRGTFDCGRCATLFYFSHTHQHHSFCIVARDKGRSPSLDPHQKKQKMSSDLSGGSGSLSNDSGPCACACACKPQIRQDLKPTETNGSAPSETRSDPFKSTNNDITTTTCPHESRDSTTLIDDDSFSSSTVNGSNINIDTPLANSHAEHPSYPEQDSLPSTPHSPPSTTNGVHNDANYQNDPELKDQSMPIAIVGIGCRFPGDATSPDKFWDLLSEGRSARGEFPKDRFNLDAFYHPSAERKGAVSLVQLQFSPLYLRTKLIHEFR